jgi:hypothetical protein
LWEYVTIPLHTRQLPVLPTAPLTPKPQDLEQIEEWNEFGELRLVVLSVQDLGGMPATSNPIPAATETKTEPEPATPKPSTIKIQSPPSKTEEKKDDKAVLALRQVSSEAASKAASKSEEKKEPAKEEPAEKPAPRGHRGSVAAELPDKRPVLVPEMAAVSSANFHADNAEELGLVEHHRGSIISTADKAEQDKVLREIRASITADEPSGNLDAIRKQAAEQKGADTIEEVATPLFENVNDTKMAAAVAEKPKAEEPKTETKESDVKEDVKDKDESKESKAEEIKEKEDSNDKETESKD